jgi:hypothetical protein
MTHEECLKKIFIYIHVWGGIAGRNIFVMGKNFEGNFKPKTYKCAIDLLRNKKIGEALKKLNSIAYLGTSFSTKHIHFWSLGELPIYDSVIAKLVFGRKTVRALHYEGYIQAIDNLITCLEWRDGILRNRQTIERGLFNWAANQGTEWLALRSND